MYGGTTAHAPEPHDGPGLGLAGVGGETLMAVLDLTPLAPACVCVCLCLCVYACVTTVSTVILPDHMNRVSGITNDRALNRGLP